MTCLDSSAFADNFMYVFGGTTKQSPLDFFNEFWSYNLYTNGWTLISNSTNAIGFRGASGVENKTYTPSGRFWTSLVYDSVGKCLYLAHGHGLTLTNNVEVRSVPVVSLSNDSFFFNFT